MDEGTGLMADDEAALKLQAAVDEAESAITRAIQAYQDLKRPGDYVANWVVITENTSIELAKENSSLVGVLSPQGQSFVVTRGLLDIALSGKRANGG